ncbi:MAG: hypothetical protein J6B72_01530 [Clostridia bacterium]|nr:hypothetical protein [Clostridia bacterium]
MKKISKIIWGIVLVAAGLVVAADIIGIVNVNYALIFDGWWTLFIIIPAIISIISNGPRTGNIIWLFVGAALFIGSRDILPFETVIKLILPIIIVIVGLSMIFGGIWKRADKGADKGNAKRRRCGKKEEYAAVFSGQDLEFMGKRLEDLSLDAIFGGIKCDLRGAIIEKDVVINANAVFGGIDLIVPIGVAVKSSSTSIFGGVTNKKSNDGLPESPVIYVNGSGIFGGVTIK